MKTNLFLVLTCSRSFANSSGTWITILSSASVSGYHESRPPPPVLLCPHRIWRHISTFQIANFLSSYSGGAAQQRHLGAPYPDSSYPAQLTEKQAGLGDQIAERQSIVVGSITTIFVVFMISLITCILTNIMFSIESIIPNEGRSKKRIIRNPQLSQAH